MSTSSQILGPFIANTTHKSVQIWMSYPEGTSVFLEILQDGKPIAGRKEFIFSEATLWACKIEISDLEPDTKYSYKLYVSATGDTTFYLDGLEDQYLFFWTMPKELNWEKYRYDFLLISCNNPDASKNSAKNRDGFEVWKTIPSIIEKHQSVGNEKEARILFALFGGDQVYADDWRDKLLTPATATEKEKIYLEVYQHFWSNIHYRKILANTPAYMMWDDHDIMDGWGSEMSSFKKSPSGGITQEFMPEWHSMFSAAKKVFRYYQANRNPTPLVGDLENASAFDVGFKVGPMGFILADLRSNRNLPGKTFWTSKQLDAVKNWVEKNRKDIDTLFFITPVVFAHGSPKIEEGVLKYWELVVKFFDHAEKTQKKMSRPWVICVRTLLLLLPFIGLIYLFITSPKYFLGLASVTGGWLIFRAYRFVASSQRQKILTVEKLRSGNLKHSILGWTLHLLAILTPRRLIKSFSNSIGDLSDDIRDSWGGPGNEGPTEEILQYLFDIQNDPDKETCVHVVILSGDIHTAGYSNIYSNATKHSERPVIPHIVSSPVGYTPFPWIGEALYRKFSIGSVSLGNSSTFSAQISHHFTERNVVICSLRKKSEEKKFLKAKYYIEGFREPQTVVFDLDKSSHLENIDWK